MIQTDFDFKLKTLKNQVDELVKAYAEARDFTESFLDCCKKHGIETVSIQKETERIPSSIGFAFGARGNAFAEERENGYPAIWSVARETDTYGGCGNGGQAQLNRLAQVMLVDGVYELKDGTWTKIE